MLHAGTKMPRLTVLLDEMNDENFEEWLTATLLPKISLNSITMIDNAPYHSCSKEPLPTQG